MDANLNHCLATGRSVTGCLHFVNHTPIGSYSKRQATVETATYGSEFVASKTATEKISDLRHTLRYLGVPIKTKSYLFGDNRSVVTSSTLPHSTLGKRHNILAYHRVREAIASKILAYHWIRTGYNLSDILSKHWDHPTHEQESTISNNDEDEYSTFSDMSKQDSESDVNVDETQHQENSYTPETLQNNTTIHDKNDLIHDEYDTSENENTIEIETIEDYGEKIHETEESIPTETSQVLTVFNKAIHYEDDSSDDKSVIEIESPEENREQEIGKQDKLLTTTFHIEIENRKVEGLITYSTDQQIFKFKVNSWGVNIEFTLYKLKCTIHAILQHMGFYHTTENPCVMMRAKHNTKSCECIIIHQDELYIASSTLQEILHIVKEKYKINIISNNYLESDFPYDPGGTMIC